jgi:hypothetical protein
MVNTATDSTGKTIFLVCGAFGAELSSAYHDGVPIGGLKKIASNCGAPMVRTFNTHQEAEAYRQGLEDMIGWNSYCFMPPDKHAKLFGISKLAGLTVK